MFRKVLTSLGLSLNLVGYDSLELVSNSLKLFAPNSYDEYKGKNPFWTESDSPQIQGYSNRPNRPETSPIDAVVCIPANDILNV